MKKKSAEWLAGKKAHQEGRSCLGCPYDLDNPVRDKWLLGWWTRHYQTEPGGPLYEPGSNPNDKEKILHLLGLLSLGKYYIKAEEALHEPTVNDIHAVLEAWKVER